VIPSYLDTLIREIKSYKDKCINHIVETIYIGGGTPSLLSAAQIGKLMTALRKNFVITDNAEITIECNPGSLTAAKLNKYKSIGINRLSLGIQSHDSLELKVLGRVQSTKSVFKALALIQRCGIENLSIDFLYNIPLPREIANANLRRDIEAEVQFLLNVAPHIKHISTYSLTPELGTPLARRLDYEELYELDEDTSIEEELDLQETLKEHGFKRYEVSNWAQKGYECKHNLNYWNAEHEYLGFGVSAHGLFDGERYENTEDLNMYLLKPNKVHSSEKRTKADLVNEIIMLGLRTKKGVSLSRLGDLGINLLAEKSKEVLELSNIGLLKTHGNDLRATEDGMFILNLLIDMLTLDKKREKSLQ